MSNELGEGKLTPAALEELQAQRLRVLPPAAARRMWDRLLSDEERQQLGGSLAGLDENYARHGTIGIWMELRHVSQPVAIVQLARDLGFLSEPDARWLLQELGEPEGEPVRTSQGPLWSRDQGVLKFENETIRNVRLLACPTNLQVILDAFEAASWPARIENPLPQSDQQTLHQTLRSLNKGLERIRFRAREGGQAVTWELV